MIEEGVETIRERVLAFFDGFQANMLTAGVAIEAAIVVAAILPAAFFGPRLRKLIQSQIAPRAHYGLLRRAANAFAALGLGLGMAAWTTGAATPFCQ